MGANNSTRRVSFESDENDNITVVKGIRLSENVINRMREPVSPLHPTAVAATPPAFLPQVPSPPPVSTPSPLLIPIPPLRSPYDPITSLPPPPPKEPVAPSLPAPVTEVVTPRPSPPPVEKLAVEPITLPPPQAEFIDPPPCESIAPPSQPPLETVAPPVVAPPAPEWVSAAPPTPPSAPPADAEEELRKKITEDLQKGLLQERVKAEQELQAWLEEEKAQTSVDAQVACILERERSVGQNTLTQAVIRERISAEDERIRAQLYAKQLVLRDQELKKQEAVYREQVARLEDRSAQFYKVTTENYQKAADEVHAKFKRFEVSPVCADLQGQILRCYQEHTGRTLLCSSIASRYLQCVNQAKQNKLRTGG